ncbi:MAG: hypothetical protein Q9167_000710 [Letrouitia subvulpina]
MVIASVEFNVGIVCSCLPTLPVLFRKPEKPSGPSYIANASSDAVRSSDQGHNSKRGFAHIEYQPRQDSISKLEEARPSVARGGGSEKAFKLMGLDKDPERTNDWFRRARA